jgi:hypothetical protein
MQRTLRTLGLVALLAVPAIATAGGSNRVYLVPAIKECPGPTNCSPREFESTYTFDAVILLAPAARFSPADKPAFVLDIKGVRDAAGALVTGNLSLKISSGRVSLPGFGTLPDGSSLTQVAPIPVPIKNGRARVSYKPPVGAPNGTITNGGGVQVLDPDGKPLAVTGSQSKP